jgi:hypothetical protein
VRNHREYTGKEVGKKEAEKPGKSYVAWYLQLFLSAASEQLGAKLLQ